MTSVNEKRHLSNDITDLEKRRTPFEKFGKILQCFPNDGDLAHS